MDEQKIIGVQSHPLSLPRAFVSTLPGPLGEFTTPTDLLGQYLKLESDAPCSRSEAIRTGVRKMLRNPGFKPTGRNKPASEYLVQAAEKQTLGSINLAVDICNIVSLNSGFPISVIDLDLVDPPFSVSICNSDSEYVFNPSGQVLKLDGLICLHDSIGPCANGVKDSQRTKTSDQTMCTLSIIWGSREFTREVEQAHDWYIELLNALGISTCKVETTVIE